MEKLHYLIPISRFKNQKAHLYCPDTEDSLCRLLSTNTININNYFISGKLDESEVCLNCKQSIDQYKNGSWFLKQKAPDDYEKIYIQKETLRIIKSICIERGLSMESIVDTSIKLAIPTLLNK